jgi:hypothetical protein
MEKGLLKAGFVILTAILVFGFLGAVRADVCVNNSIPGGTDATIPITLGTTYTSNCVYSLTFAGSDSWSQDVFELDNWPGGALTINVLDCCLVGDYYSVWQVNATTGTILADGMYTPEVYTGPQLNDSAIWTPPPPYHFYETGTGTTYSQGTFTVILPPGTYQFMVRDELLDQIAAEPSGAITLETWSPAGFYITFSAAPTSVVGEVPLGPIVASASMMMALVGFVAMPRLKRKLYN